MDTGLCAGKRGLLKCRGELLPYEYIPGEVRQAFCTKCFVEWNISVYGDGCVKFEKRAPCRFSLPQTYKPVKSTEDLQKGDHVLWTDGSHSTRHGLIMKILNPKEVRVFSLNPEGKGKIAKVNLDLTTSAITLAEYCQEELNKVHNPVSQVILRARSHSKRRGTFTSGKQFVVFCKTGYVKRFEMGQSVRKFYEEARLVVPTMVSLEVASNVSILVFNILLAVFIESWVECKNCTSRENTSCVKRRYWFLSEILLTALEGLVFLFYVVYELYIGPNRGEYTRTLSDEQPRSCLKTHRGVLRCSCEFLLGIIFALLMTFCNCRRSFCVMWCKVFVGTIFGVIGKLLGYLLGQIVYRKLDPDEPDEQSCKSLKEDPVT